jgi:hypothetical protein
VWRDRLLVLFRPIQVDKLLDLNLLPQLPLHVHHLLRDVKRRVFEGGGEEFLNDYVLELLHGILGLRQLLIDQQDKKMTTPRRKSSAQEKEEKERRKE